MLAWTCVSVSDDRLTDDFKHRMRNTTPVNQPPPDLPRRPEGFAVLPHGTQRLINLDV